MCDSNQSGREAIMATNFIFTPNPSRLFHPSLRTHHNTPFQKHSATITKSYSEYIDDCYFSLPYAYRIAANESTKFQTSIDHFGSTDMEHNSCATTNNNSKIDDSRRRRCGRRRRRINNETEIHNDRNIVMRMRKLTRHLSGPVLTTNDDDMTVQASTRTIIEEDSKLLTTSTLSKVELASSTSLLSQQTSFQSSNIHKINEKRRRGKDSNGHIVTLQTKQTLAPTSSSYIVTIPNDAIPSPDNVDDDFDTVSTTTSNSGNITSHHSRLESFSSSNNSVSDQSSLIDIEHDPSYVWFSNGGRHACIRLVKNDEDNEMRLEGGFVNDEGTLLLTDIFAVFPLSVTEWVDESGLNNDTPSVESETPTPKD